jgi:hypothetical protein
MDDIQRLFDAYAEDALSDQNRQALDAWLQESDAHVDEFVRETFLHWQLFDVAQQQHLHDDVMAASPGLDAASLGLSAVNRGSASRQPKTDPRRSRFSLAAVASAAIAAAALLGYFALRPHTVAQLTQTSPKTSWAVGGAPRVGSLLHAGERLQLRSGRALATLVSGARIILDGPADVRIDGDNRLWLQTGRLGVEVPTQATGLVVDSPLGRFVDLGTEFTIAMQPETGCEIQVFTGMVEMTPADGDRVPVRVTTGSAVSYDAASGDVKFLPYDEGQKLVL